MPDFFNSLLSKAGLFTGIVGLLGLLLWKWTASPVYLMCGFFALLVASICFAMETIIRREEFINNSGDYGLGGYIKGVQALASGLSYLILGLSILLVAGAWLLFGGDSVKGFLFRDYPGIPVLLVGAWLFFQFVGVVFGQALCNVGHAREKGVAGFLQAVNAMLEKGISVIWTVVGALLMTLGAASMVSGQGPLGILLKMI